MTYKLFQSLAITALIGCVPAALRAQPVTVSVPLLVCSGLPCVEATIPGGRHLRLLIDTGDVQPILAESAATAAGLELKEVSGADGKPVNGFHKTRVSGLKIGDVGLADYTALVVDLKVATNGHALDADGFLTYPLLKERLLRIDFIHKTVSVSAPVESAVACKGKCALPSSPTFGKKGPPIVVTKSFSVNGKPLSVQVDTLYAGSLLVFPNAVQKLGLGAESRSQTKEFFPYTDGGVDMVKGSAKNVSFDGLSLVDNPAVYFATPEVHTPDDMFDGTVGSAVLTGTMVTFDFHDNWMSMSK